MFIGMCTLTVSPALSPLPESKIFLLGSSLRWHISRIWAVDPQTHWWPRLGDCWTISHLAKPWNWEVITSNLTPRMWGTTMWLSHIRLSSQERCASYVLPVEKKFHPVRLFEVFPRLSVPCSWKAEMYLLGTLLKQFKMLFCVSSSLKEKGQQVVQQIDMKHW